MPKLSFLGCLLAALVLAGCGEDQPQEEPGGTGTPPSQDPGIPGSGTQDPPAKNPGSEDPAHKTPGGEDPGTSGVGDETAQLVQKAKLWLNTATTHLKAKKWSDAKALLGKLTDMKDKLPTSWRVKIDAALKLLKMGQAGGGEATNLPGK